MSIFKITPKSKGMNFTENCAESYTRESARRRLASVCSSTSIQSAFVALGLETTRFVGQKR